MEDRSTAKDQREPGDSEAGSLKPRRKRRRYLDRAMVTAVAVQVADGEGLDAVSIRRIAAELDARPMSLYDYFASKDDLLDSMVEQVVGEVLLPALPPHWRDAVGAIGRHTYTVLRRHPWLVIRFGRQPRFGPASRKAAEQAATAMEDLPVGEAERWEAFAVVIDYILGHSLRAVTAPDASDLEEMISEAEMEESPQLASLSDSYRTRASAERFEIGLQTVLDGIEKRFLA